MSPEFSFKKLEEEVKNSRNPLILTHEDPDGDALGSALALSQIFREEGVNIKVFLSGKIESGLEFLKIPKEYFEQNVNLENYDLIIIVDTNNPQRTGAAIPEDLSELPKTFIIDHHIFNSKNGYPDNFKSVIIPQKTAVCEIIFDLLKIEGKDFSMTTAFYLLLGIFTDSGGFFHSNTTPNLLKKVRELLKKGVPFRKIAQSADKKRGVETLNFWGDKIKESKINERLGFLFTSLSKEEMEQRMISSEEIGGLANLLNLCKEAKFSMFLREEGGKLKGSLRSSAHKNIDVSTIARFLKGGGHKLASGFELEGKIVERDGKMEVKGVEKSRQEELKLSEEKEA